MRLVDRPITIVLNGTMFVLKQLGINTIGL